MNTLKPISVSMANASLSCMPSVSGSNAGSPSFSVAGSEEREAGSVKKALNLHARQGCTLAEVQAVAKREVLVEIAGDVESERFVEHVVISVGRDVVQQN